MDRRELDKKMRADVKPGTESIAINEAQTAANQLLTEQRMNNESARAIMTSNSERDTELRGAIELGAMNQPQAATVVQQLPAQAAGLRPETQQLLAKYGVNPQISERSRTSSNNTQTRSTNTVRKDAPSPQGGRTTVTNTTNITNITNNNSKVETDIDMADSRPAPTPQPVQRVVAQPVAAQGGDGKFKAFLNNLFAKRDLERRTQEKEFRKRDWELQRMTRKVMERMEKISTTFAKKMDPSNVGKTYGSQLKMMLTMAGLTLLPKLFPKLISGLNVIGDAFRDTKGSFFTKLTAALTTGVSKLAGSVVGALEGVGTVISRSLAQLIAGKDWDPKNPIGLAEAIGNEIVDFFKGDGAHKFESFGEMMSKYFKESWKELKEFFEVALEDRATAIKTVWEKDRNGWDLSPTNLLKTMGEMLAAALGGHRALATLSVSNRQNEAKTASTFNVHNDDKDILGNVRSVRGGHDVLTNLQRYTNFSNTDPVIIQESLHQLSKLGLNEKQKDESFIITSDEIERIISKMRYLQTDPEKYVSNVRFALINAVNDEIFRKGKFTRKFNGREETVNGYNIKVKYLPQLVALLNGNLAPSSIIDHVIKSDLSEQDSHALVSELNNKLYRWDRARKLDKELIKNGVYSETKFKNEDIALELANEYEKMYNNAFKELSDASGLTEVKEKLTEMQEDLKEKTKGPQSDFQAARNNVSSGVMNAVANEDGTLNTDKLWDGAKNVWNSATGKASEVVNTTGNIAHEVLYETDMNGNNPSPVSQSGQVPVTTPKSKTQTQVKENEIDEVTWIENRAQEILKRGYHKYQGIDNIITDINTARKLAAEDYTNEILSKRNRTPLEQRIQYAMNFLTSNGFTAEQAAGMTGVLIAESTLDPGAVNPQEANDPKIGYHKAGKGIAQWSNDRNDDFIKWYQSTYNTKDKVYPNQAPMDAQLKFMMHEMAQRTPFMDAMKKAETVDQAADVMLRGYENGSAAALASKSDIDKTYAKYNNGYDRQLTERIGYARNVYELHTGNKLTGPIDSALLEGRDYTGSSAEVTDFGDKGSNWLADTINWFNEQVGTDPNYEYKPSLETVDGGALKKYTQATESGNMPSAYSAGELPELTVTAAKMENVTPVTSSIPAVAAANKALNVAEKPQASSESTETKTDQPNNYVNNGGNMYRGGDKIDHHNTVIYQGFPTANKAAISLTEGRN